MEIWYQDTDITGSVIPSACVHRDVSHGRADTLEITFRRSAAWHRWEPMADDRIRVIESKYDTGILYVNTIVPEGDRYRMLATSLPSKAARKAWDSYKNLSLKEIIHRCAMECDMGDGLYGVSEDIRYPFLMRQNEGCAAFLERLATIVEKIKSRFKIFSYKFRTILANFQSGNTK